MQQKSQTIPSFPIPQDTTSLKSPTLHRVKRAPQKSHTITKEPYNPYATGHDKSKEPHFTSRQKSPAKEPYNHKRAIRSQFKRAPLYIAIRAIYRSLKRITLWNILHKYMQQKSHRINSFLLPQETTGQKSPISHRDIFHLSVSETYYTETFCIHICNKRAIQSLCRRTRQVKRTPLYTAISAIYINSKLGFFWLFI